MDPRVHKAIRFIQDALNEKISLPDLAREARLSPTHFRYLFKAEVGMTPAQYQKTLRMMEARRLLENTFLNVQEIMVSVGLYDESHFVRDFKKAYGLTPLQHRMRHHHHRTGKETET